MEKAYKTIILIITATLLLSVVGCGIEYILALEQPIYIETSETLGTFKVFTDSRHDVPIPDQFLGVEFYYKFYEIDTDPEGDLENVDQLVQRGFFRLTSETEDSPSFITRPLVYIPSSPIYRRDHRIDITLDFSDMDDVYLNAYDDTDSIDLSDYSHFMIRRGVYDIIDEFKSFSDLDIDPDDDDLSSLDENAVLNRELKIAIYSVTFGKQDFTDAYSKPLFLFDINPFD
jgi:hypothetical protein